HYYQPLWTLVGGGIKPLEESAKPMTDVMPKICKWFKTRGKEFQPDKNLVILEDGTELSYEFLIIAVGLQLRFDMVKNLPEALGTPGIGSNYSAATVMDTWKNLQSFQGGNAIFTVPNTPIKCLGAPQKIMYITEDYLRQVRFDSGILILHIIQLQWKFFMPFILIIEKNNARHLGIFLLPVILLNSKCRIIINNNVHLGLALFRYDLLHVTPPMSPPECLRGSPVSDERGYVDVNKITTQHKTYENIFGIGDCTNSPNGKTAAAVAGQSGVLKANLYSLMEGKPMRA
ncbi:predicted protein, partial [Nematostella vectensis]